MGHLWDMLLGEGSLELDAAIRFAATKLRDEGAVSLKRLRRGGKLYTAIEEAIALGLETGQFDEPADGCVRAVLRDPGDYQPKDWKMVVEKALNGAEVAGDDAVRAAADWAAENMGLEVGGTRVGGAMKALRVTVKDVLKADKQDQERQPS